MSLVQYVGSAGYHQDDDRDINTLPLNSPYREAVANGTATSTNLYRSYPGFSDVTQEEVGTNSSYHALQAELRMQPRNGLSVQLAYTWSHEIDIVSGDLGSVSNLSTCVTTEARERSTGEISSAQTTSTRCRSIKPADRNGGGNYWADEPTTGRTW